jgi:hypothetical protein
MEITELKVPTTTKYTAEELRRIINLAFGDVEEFSTVDGYHVIKVSNFRYWGISMRRLLKNGGVTHVFVNGFKWCNDNSIFDLKGFSDNL